MSNLNIKNVFLTGVFGLAISISGFSQQGQVNIQQDEKIPELLNLKTRLTKDAKLGERFQIQLYYGDNNKASEVIKQFRANYPEWPSQVIYETPNYKVWVGNFRSRLEADRALRTLKAEYPSAFIPKPQRI